MMIKLFLITWVLLLVLANPLAAADDKQPVPDAAAGESLPRVAMFYQAGLSMELNAIAMKTVLEMSDTFMRLGRFYPVSWKTTMDALSEANDSVDISTVARDLDADIFCTIFLERNGNMYSVLLKTSALNKRFKGLEGQIAVRSRIVNNIPLKIAREVAWLHKNLGIHATVTAIIGNEAVITAGEWQGLRPGTFPSDRGSIKVLKTSRYSSVIRTEPGLVVSDLVMVESFPEWRQAVSDIEILIDKSTIFSSSPTVEELKGDDYGKRFAKTFCIINNAASLILPGYGSYLACGYLGIKQKVSIPNVVITPLIVFTQLTLTEMMTGFTTNFAPWIQDSDKTDAVQNLQIFCWATLFTTYAASFLDQLAYQCELTRKLPPFFEHRDQAAAFLSLLVPGGGLYYKGYRIAGWSFYFAEMALAGFGAYYTGTDRKNYYAYAFGALALVKVVDIICAYLVDPTFSVYRLERERQAGRMSFSMNVVPDHMGKNVFAVSCGMQF